MKNWLTAGNSDMPVLSYSMYEQQEARCQTISSQAFECVGNATQPKRLNYSQRFMPRTSVGKTTSPILALTAQEKRTPQKRVSAGKQTLSSTRNTVKIAGRVIQKRHEDNDANLVIDCAISSIKLTADTDVRVVEKLVEVCSPSTISTEMEMSIEKSFPKENHMQPEDQDSVTTYTGTCGTVGFLQASKFFVTTAISLSTVSDDANTRLKVQRLSRKGVHRKLSAVEMPVTPLG